MKSLSGNGENILYNLPAATMDIPIWVDISFCLR